jgi:hypothetical protein
MATTNKAPSGTYSFSSGTIAYTGGGANYTNLIDANSGSYAQFTGANSFASWPLADMPSDLSVVTAVTINIREAQGSSKGDFGNLSSVQIFKSDGTTAITSSVTATDTTTPTTFNLTPSTISFTDKTSWDGAVIKVLQDGGTGTGIRVYELNVDITYTASTTATETLTSTQTWTCPAGVTSVQVECIGGGGGGGGGDTNNSGGGGGGGGAYSIKTSFATTPGVGYTATVGAGGSAGNSNGTDGSVGGDTWFSTSGTVLAKGGGYGTGSSSGDGPGPGGTGGSSVSGVGDTKRSGGNGASGAGSTATAVGGGGGGSAGTAASGNNATGVSGGAAVTGGGYGGNANIAGGQPGGGGGGNYGAGTVGGTGRIYLTYTATVATAAEGVTILRPISNLNYQWWQYGFDNIDDDLTQPTGSAGDGLFCNVQAELAGAQQWGVLAPYPTHTIYGAKVWLRAKYEVYPAKISGIRIRLGGTWYDYGNPNETLNLGYTWYGYGITGLSVSASGADPAIEIYMAAVPGGAGYVGKMDVAYLELDYTPIGGSGVIVGVGTFSGAGRVRGGTGEVIGVGAFSGSGGKHGGAGGVVGTGDLSGVGLAVHFGFGDVTGSGSLSGAGPPYFGGFGTITGVGTLSGEGPPPTMLTALAAAVEALGLPPIMVTALTTVAETLGTGDPPPPDVTALAISTEVLGSPVVFEPIYTSAKFLAVETLGGPSLGPWMLFVQGCVVETLGFSGVKSWREHEELFLLPWSTIR